jgi:hypothetical protein
MREQHNNQSVIEYNRTAEADVFIPPGGSVVTGLFVSRVCCL